MWKQWVVTLSTLGQLGCTCCIARGSRVRTPGGERPIEDLAIGDELVVVDPETRLTHTGRITEIRRAKRECARLVFAEGSLAVTPSHPLFDPTANQWAPAGDWILGLRDRVLRFDAEGALREEQVIEVNRFVGMDDVFDLTVDHPAHTFVANGVLVHNKTPIRQPCRGPDGGVVTLSSHCFCPGGDDGFLTCPEGVAVCSCRVPQAYFSSDWGWRTGIDDDALLEKNRWTRATCPDRSTVLAVVPSVGNRNGNALRITERGEGVCGRIEKASALPEDLEHWGQVEFNVDSTVPNDTVVLGAPTPQFTLLGLHNDDAGVRVFLRARFDAAGQPLAEPAGLWVSEEALLPRTFHSFEWRFERLTSTTFRVWPRADLHFSAPSADGGQISLGDWYDAGNAFGLVDAGDVRAISIGTDGPPGSSDGGGHWYVDSFWLFDEVWLP